MQIFENCRNLCYRVGCIFVGRIYNIYDMAKDTTNEELLGSQRGAAKKICGSTIIERLINCYQTFFCQRNVQVTNLNVNFYLTVEEEKISEVRIGDVSEVSFRSPGNQLVQEQHNYGGRLSRPKPITIMVPCIRGKAKVVRMAFPMSR